MRKLVVVLLAIAATGAPALAEDPPEEIRIALLGGSGAAERIAANECLRVYIERALGIPTRLFAPADYDGAVHGLLAGTIDVAWLGPASYARAFLADPEAVEPVLVMVRADGTFGYHALAVARKDSAIASLDDARGKAFGFSDPASVSGYLIPSIEITEATGMDAGEFFGEVRFTGGYAQTIAAVNAGEIEAGVVWADGSGAWEDGYTAGALRVAVEAGQIDMNDLVEIWRSRPIPEGPVVLRKALPAEVRRKITEVYARLAETDSDCVRRVAGGDTLGFRPTGPDAYGSVVAAWKRMGE